MKKKSKPAGADSSGGEKKEKRKKLWQGVNRVTAAVVTVLLMILAVLVFMLRDGLKPESGSSGILEKVEDFTYETGAGQTFCRVGNGAAVASNSSIQLLDADGHTVFKQVVSYSTPAIYGWSRGALFCDIGGTGCVYCGLDGESREIDCAGNIISADVSANGWLTVVTEETGYKGLASVYDAAGQLIYRWWSGTGYILKALMSPDNAHLAVFCVDSGGGSLHCFSVTSEEELYSVSFPMEIIFDARFMGSGTLCALSEERAYFLGPDGAEKGRYEIGDYYLTDYELSDELIALCLNVYSSGSGGMLVTVGPGGELLGYTETERNLLSMSISGRQLLVMTSGDLSLYSSDMGLLSQNETLMTAKKAILRERGDILLMSAYSAEKFSF